MQSCINALENTAKAASDIAETATSTSRNTFENQKKLEYKKKLEYYWTYWLAVVKKNIAEIVELHKELDMLYKELSKYAALELKINRQCAVRLKAMK